MSRPVATADVRTIDREGLDALIRALGAQGRRVIGPVLRDGAIVTGPVTSVDDLPAGVVDHQEAGGYHLEGQGNGALFHHGVGPHTWKRYLYPPVRTLWTARRVRRGFETTPNAEPTPRQAFLGVRGCDLAALSALDRVLRDGPYADPCYAACRAEALVIAVNCTRPGGTCFCVSMGGGPKVAAGYDLALTELPGEDRHVLLVEAGSEAGAALLAGLPSEPADRAALAAAEARLAEAVDSMGRDMIPDVAQVLRDGLTSGHWDDVARRCLSCANCTLVCPTCFCSTVEDVTDLTGGEARRERRWDSCFTLDFSYIHGGHIRRGGDSRYRQWITHKLAHWHDQFGTSGCTGCGRCITWCPVGIDITEEAKAIKNREGRT